MTQPDEYSNRIADNSKFRQQLAMEIEELQKKADKKVRWLGKNLDSKDYDKVVEEYKAIKIKIKNRMDRIEYANSSKALHTGISIPENIKLKLLI